MSSYSYVNGCYQVTTEILDGWHRFNRMNAQVQHLVSQAGNTEHWNLISYNTPICRVTRHGINGNDIYRIDLSHDWNCSVSTQRQLRKFFEHYNLPCNNYWCNELEKLNLYNGISEMHINDYVWITFIDNEKLLNWMISNGSRRNSFPMNIVND